MPLFTFNRFRGEAPMVPDHLLTPEHADIADNVRLHAGTLQALRAASIIAVSALNQAALTIFRYSALLWMEFLTVVDIVRSPVANDTHGRVYWVGDSYARQASATMVSTGGPPYPGSSYRLGLPAPSAAPGVSLGGSGSGTPETRFYLITYVDSFGAEGPPSDPSASISVLPGETVSVSWGTVPSAPYNVTHVRIYRSNTVGDTAQWQFVAQATAGSSPYVDSVAGADLGEVLPSETWFEPPTGLTNLVAAPSYLAGSVKNALRCSEVGLPHAWPEAYEYPVDDEIVAVGVLPNGFVGVTLGRPYLFLGTHPGSLSSRPVELPFSCVAKASLVSTGSAVVYASTHGLVSITSSSANLVTGGLLEREQWEALNPASFKAAYWRGYYVAFFTDAEGNDRGLILDPAAPENGIVFITGVDLSALVYDKATGDLFLASQFRIAKFDAGTPLTYTWRSRIIELAAPAPIGVVQVFAEAYPVDVLVVRDGVDQALVTVTSKDPVRVLNAELGVEYQVEVSGTNTVKSVVIGSTMAEFKRSQPK